MTRIRPDTRYNIGRDDQQKVDKYWPGIVILAILYGIGIIISAFYIGPGGLK